MQRLNELSDEAARAAKGGDKRAVVVLNDLMKTAMSFAALEQRKILEYPRNEKGEQVIPQQMLDRFWKAMECAGTFAKALAPFQDPTFKAITVVAPPPAPANDSKMIDGTATRINDPIEVSRIYQQLVRSVR